MGLAHQSLTAFPAIHGALALLSPHNPRCCTTEEPLLRFLSNQLFHETLAANLNNTHCQPRARPRICSLGFAISVTTWSSVLIDAPVNHAATLRHPSSQDILPKLLSVHVTGHSSKFLEALYQPSPSTMDTSWSRSRRNSAGDGASCWGFTPPADGRASRGIRPLFFFSCLLHAMPLSVQSTGARSTTLPTAVIGHGFLGHGGLRAMDAWLLGAG
ncbi:hypothetical protein B0T18DRAFT_137116 [Schizothecium vesticola]|uniref:Uncharacterized protein n=1 Tax=Schizothecium vesticola TaxID=314040 RepID=A0AA40EUG2_9PEZI|nr:hypothetical protein B0T18DRAFT_137116 [Schizothecium vesticola]